MSRKKLFCSFFTRNNGTFAGKLKIIMMKKMNLLLMATMLSAAAFAGNGKTSTTLPVEGEVVKASHPMIQYMGRVSLGKNPDVASFNFPGTTIEANFQGSSLKMMCRPMTGSAENMPWQYEYTLFNKHDEKWDFAKYQPQLVCINLGTNDFSTDNYDIQLYEKNYRMFLTTVRSKYPDAKIVLLTGPMLGNKESSEQRAVLDRICADANKSGFTLVNKMVVDKKGKIKKAKKQGDKEIYRFDFSFQRGDLGYGASWHPSKLQHQKMAKELLPFLKNLMNW